MRLIGLRGHDENEGVCLIWKCPQCEAERSFQLVTGHVQLSVAGLVNINGSEALVVDLRCVQCHYDFRVPPQERESVEQVRELTEQLTAGGLTKEAYVAKVKALPMKFVKDLLALTEEWKCGDCGEENPITFGNCWKCQSKHNTGAGLSGDAKPLPGFRTHTNPWDL